MLRRRASTAYWPRLVRVCIRRTTAARLSFASLGVASIVVFAVGLRGDRARSLAGLMFLEVVFAAMLRLSAGVLDLTVGEFARIVAIVACVTAFVVRRERGR